MCLKSLENTALPVDDLNIIDCFLNFIDSFTKFNQGHGRVVDDVDSRAPSVTDVTPLQRSNVREP